MYTEAHMYTHSHTTYLSDKGYGWVQGWLRNGLGTV